MQKSKVPGYLFVEQTEGMRHVHLPEPFQAVAFAHGVASGCFLAAAVEREHCGFLEGTWMKRAGRMGQMVRHEMPFERLLGSHAAKARFEMMRRSIRKLARSID